MSQAGGSWSLGRCCPPRHLFSPSDPYWTPAIVGVGSSTQRSGIGFQWRTFCIPTSSMISIFAWTGPLLVLGPSPWLASSCGWSRAPRGYCHDYFRSSPSLFDFADLLTTSPGHHHYAHLAFIITPTCASSLSTPGLHYLTHYLPFIWNSLRFLPQEVLFLLFMSRRYSYVVSFHVICYIKLTTCT